MVCHLPAVPSVHVQEVDVVDDDEAGLAVGDALGGPLRQPIGGAPLRARQAVEAAEHGVQAPHRRVRGEAHIDDRDALPAATTDVDVWPVALDLGAVERLAEGQRRGRLAEAGEGVEHGGRLHLVAVLAVGADDLLERLEQGADPGRADRADVGVPEGAGVVVGEAFSGRHGRELLGRVGPGPPAGRELGHGEPARLGGRVPVPLVEIREHRGGLGAHRITPNASA